MASTCQVERLVAKRQPRKVRAQGPLCSSRSKSKIKMQLCRASGAGLGRAERLRALGVHDRPPAPDLRRAGHAPYRLLAVAVGALTVSKPLNFENTTFLFITPYFKQTHPTGFLNNKAPTNIDKHVCGCRARFLLYFRAHTCGDSWPAIYLQLRHASYYQLLANTECVIPDSQSTHLVGNH